MKKTDFPKFFFIAAVLFCACFAGCAAPRTAARGQAPYQRPTLQIDRDAQESAPYDCADLRAELDR